MASSDIATQAEQHADSAALPIPYSAPTSVPSAKTEQYADPGALAGEAEPWEPWETRLVVASLATGAAALVVLGWLVDRFILS